MSKKTEEKYRRYLYSNFSKLCNYSDNKREYSNDWFDELVAYNNIMGSLIGLIESKGAGKEFQDCKNFILKYYESTYPEKQLKAVDDALYSENCFEYINYAIDNLVCDRVDLEILRSFSKAYLRGYNLSNEVSLRKALPYYSKKIHEYANKLHLNNNNQKLYQI